MIDIDTRLHALRDDPALANAPLAPSPDQLRERARRHKQKRSRRVGAAALGSIAAVVALVVVVAGPDETNTDVTVGPPTSVESQNGQRSLGDVSGVTLSVSPSRDLHDGDLVDVQVQGLDQLPNAVIVMCAGDVTEATAMNACDFAAVTDPDASQPGQVYAAPQKVVSVPRFIDITARSSDPNVALPFDCAREPAGCVLAVGPFALPARGVAVPLQFVDDPVSTPTIQVSPSTGLTNGQQIVVTGEGLQPNAVVPVQLCRAEPVNNEGTPARLCDGYSWGNATTDGAGHTTYDATVWATLYTWQGPIDCTAEECVVAFTDESYRVRASAPLAFASGAATIEPRLRISPSGPYADKQDVTVSGTGFRPGIDVGGEIGQCPSDKDTAKEERCSYSVIGSTIVDEAGRFTMQVKISENLLFTGSCKEGAGCHLGWIINHGPTLAKVPLTFR